MMGTVKGAITDANGDYKITDVENEAVTLVISYSGYATQEIRTDGKKAINVQLAIETKEINEVVVTAFGQQKQKRSLGYATQVVKGEELTEAREDRMFSGSLKGKVAGVFVSPL